MIDEEQYIAKGDYRRPQIGNFILVKQYLFLRRNGKKVLLMRFFNELGHTVDGMDYTVFQYDAGGNPLARARVSHGDMQFLPGEFYAPGTAVEVEEACADFSVVFSEVRSDRYRYRVMDGGVSVFYVRRPPSEARARKEKKSEGGWRAAPLSPLRKGRRSNLRHETLLRRSAAGCGAFSLQGRSDEESVHSVCAG